MCGVVGVSLNNPTKEDIITIKRVFLETEIRGKHASGIAWVDKYIVKCIKEPVPISELLSSFDLNETISDNKIQLIGHIRYSTSDVEYNQPIGTDNSYIVHNGVITQEDASKWESHFGFKCATKNDSELLYHCIKNGEDYLSKFPGCSVSALYIDTTGIKFFRNSLRPQWIGFIEDRGYIISSTKNILLRAGIRNIVRVEPDDSKELINRNMNESYRRLQTIL